jgi:hypothetical protein
MVSTLDLVGPGLTVFTGPHPSGWEHAASAARPGPPVVVRRLDHLTARALGIPVDGALLVRPDGSPVASWPAPTALVGWPGVGAMWTPAALGPLGAVLAPHAA